MSEPKIKPRVDEDGVGWCDAGCSFKENTFCTFDKGGGKSMFTIQHNFHNGDVCPVAARRNAALLRDLSTEIKKLRSMLGPDGDYAVCSATEGEPVMRLVDSVIVGCVMEQIDVLLERIGE